MRDEIELHTDSMSRLLHCRIVLLAVVGTLVSQQSCQRIRRPSNLTILRKHKHSSIKASLMMHLRFLIH